MLRIDDLIGVRFTNHGRSITEGFDCYGLAIEVSRRLGHRLDDLWYQEACPVTFSNNAELIVRQMSDRVRETSERKLGNLIVFSDSRGNMVHIGVILDENKFIHADIGGVRVTELGDYYRKNWKVYTWLR
jgi:cell wall-associated NlpC family hydrolase